MIVDFKGFWELLKDLFTNDKYMRRALRVFFTFVFALPIIYFLVAWLSFELRAQRGEHLTFLGSERNIPAPEKIMVHDTTIRHDITYMPNKAANSKPTISQKVEKGGKGFQNNAPNYGNQANGDIINEPKLTDAIKADVVKRIENFKTENGITSNVVMVVQAPNSNAPTLALELKRYLISKGYLDGGSVGAFSINKEIKEIEIIKAMGCIDVVVGNFDVKK